VISVRCPGSGIVLDGPKGLTQLTCPNCAKSIPVRLYDPLVPRWIEAPRWVLRGHRVIMTEKGRIVPLFGVTEVTRKIV
jgi:hypothetical protein